MATLAAYAIVTRWLCIVTLPRSVWLLCCARQAIGDREELAPQSVDGQSVRCRGVRCGGRRQLPSLRIVADRSRRTAASRAQLSAAQCCVGAGDGSVQVSRVVFVRVGSSAWCAARIDINTWNTHTHTQKK